MRHVDDINVTAEVEKLRLHYGQLSKKKKEEIDKKKELCENGQPSKRQMDLYEEGRRKLLIERSKEEESLHVSEESLSKRDPTPIPICDRLYEQGMNKVMAEKKAEMQAEEAVRGRDSSRDKRNLSESAICNRLYEQGMNKLMAEKLAEKKAEDAKQREAANRRHPSNIPICDRLYEQGMTKITTEKEKAARVSGSTPRRFRSRPSSASDDNIFDRLYNTPTKRFNRAGGSKQQERTVSSIDKIKTPRTRDSSPMPYVS
mmetsp:Transcript_8740/g.10092  ORF Transcript_8740/g.10092 Transcript_8740/m.10092 type:complete len:259 (-) Transcript_8740:118-894(-)